MFSLVRFENGEYYVTPSFNVIIKTRILCSVKLKGEECVAKLILKSDDKSYLLECKNKYKYFSKLYKLSSTSSRMQLVPLINKLEVQNYLNRSHTDIPKSISSANIQSFTTKVTPAKALSSKQKRIKVTLSKLKFQPYLSQYISFLHNSCKSQTIRVYPIKPSTERVPSLKNSSSNLSFTNKRADVTTLKQLPADGKYTLKASLTQSLSDHISSRNTPSCSSTITIVDDSPEKQSSKTKTIPKVPTLKQLSKSPSNQKCQTETTHLNTSNSAYTSEPDLRPLRRAPSASVVKNIRIFSSSAKSSRQKENYNSSIFESCLSKNTNRTKKRVLSVSYTTLEHFPHSVDTTDDNQRSTKNSTAEQDYSVEVIKNPLTLSNVQVPHTSLQSKKHFCIFCKTLQTKLSRHLYLKHKSEGRIKEALKFPIKSKERLQLVEELRKEGDFLHNTSEEHNSGILIVSRRQQKERQNGADEYVCCKNCKAFFSKNTIRIHLKKCGNTKSNSRDNFICSRRLTQYIHAAANVRLRTEIFPVLRNDDITKCIRYDELIIKYANKLSEKYTLTHQHDSIRSQLRLLGRFLKEARSLNSSIKQLKDIFKPILFNTCVEALRKAASWDDALMWFRTPAVAQQLTCLIKKCGSQQRKELLKAQSEESRKELDKFLVLWEKKTPLLFNKKALGDQCYYKCPKKEILPSKNDIKKLYLLVKEEMLDAIGTLQTEFNTSCWNDLVKLSLVLILIFNRRPASEIERLTVNSYLNKEIITEYIDNEILDQMSKELLLFAKQFVRLIVRDKYGRTVNVLLTPLCTKAIDFILKHRADAGISKKNEFIFSKKVISKFDKPYYSACPLLKHFSEECGVEIPESLGEMSLRKHIASYTLLLHIVEATEDELADFMGHETSNKTSVPVIEIRRVFKFLMSTISDANEADEDEEHQNLKALEGENDAESSLYKQI